MAGRSDSLMRKKIFILILLSMILPFAYAADDPKNPPKEAPIAGEMDRFLGDWTGKPNITDPKMVEQSPQEHLLFKPALSGKFLLLESNTELNGKTTAERIGFLSYNRDIRTFLLYWFDSDGNSTKYLGKDMGESFDFKSVDPDNGMTLSFVPNGDTRFRIETMKTTDKKPTLVFYSKDIAPSNGRGGGGRRGGHRGGMGM